MGKMRWRPRTISILQEDDKYSSDLEYLEAMTERFGSHMMRDVCACKSGGHTDISQFSADEWQHFKDIYGRVITQFLLADEIRRHADQD